MPKRIQLSRKKGYRKPADAVNVARPTRWGNPYKVGDPDPVHCGPMTAADAVFWFEADFDPAISENAEKKLAEVQRELAGKDLACWCKPDDPCHADVLLRLANKLQTEVN